MKKALEHFQQTLKIEIEIGNRLGQATALGNLGNVYLQKDDLDKALEHFQQALKIDIEIGNRLGQANALCNLGNVYALKLELDKALERYQRALEFFQQIGAIMEVEQTKQNIELVLKAKEMSKQ